MRKALVMIAVCLALTATAVAPAHAGGASAIPDGVAAPSEDGGIDLWAWLQAVFGDAGPHGDPWG